MDFSEYRLISHPAVGQRDQGRVETDAVPSGASADHCRLAAALAEGLSLGWMVWVNLAGTFGPQVRED